MMISLTSPVDEFGSWFVISLAAAYENLFLIDQALVGHLFPPKSLFLMNALFGVVLPTGVIENLLQ